MTIIPPFGRLATAMVTPFKKDLSIDWDGVSTLANHLVSTGHDAIVVNGTTGEAPTTSDDEKDQIIKVVLEAVGRSLMARVIRQPIPKLALGAYRKYRALDKPGISKRPIR